LYGIKWPVTEKKGLLLSHYKMKRTKALLQKTVLLYPIVFIIPYVCNKSKSIMKYEYILEEYYYFIKEKNSYFFAVSKICNQCILRTVRLIQLKSLEHFETIIEEYFS
jgi:hypothetical protein